MDSLAPLRVEDDQGNFPNSPASVESGQASHAPLVNEPEQVAVSRPDSRSDPIGGSEPFSGTRDHILGLFT